MGSGDPLADRLFLAFQTALTGRYSIDRELGRGGMGVVYLAREVHLDRMVAIKLLPPDRAVDPSFRDRFLREARLAAKLSHPNIIPIHAVDETQGFVYYVMAFVDGETLAQRVRTRGPLPSSECTRVLREAAWALSHAHSHGLVHRDVKPDNILLESPTGRVLVADFGIAAAARDTANPAVSGTPEFMSPEQALGNEVDARSDIYALGVTAFYALTGRLPFEGKSATEVLAKQITETAPPVASMGVPVARRLGSLVDRCLAKDPAQRPASADALAEQMGLAIEQRRELPAALRAFVKRSARMDGVGTALLPSVIGAAAIAVSVFINAPAGYATLFAGAVAAPFGYFVYSARRLMRLGFAHPDVGPAFAAELEQSRDEHAVDHGRGASLVERLMLRTARISGAVSAISFAAGKLLFEYPRYLVRGDWVLGPWQVPPQAAFTAAAISVVSALVYLSLVVRRRDIDTEFWSKVWTGRVGKAAFAVARRLLGKGARATAITHRATELALGMAAESLFESLPAKTRASLGDLPALVRRLQDDAQRLRKLHDELQEGLGGAADVVMSDTYRELSAERERIHTKLGDAVGALETIRLNLLRLHAGSGSVEGLTTHIDLAAEVSAEVERMLAARAEVDRSLSFPRETAATPA